MADSDEYDGKAYEPVPPKYQGEIGQRRRAKDGYRSDECETVVGVCMAQAKERLARGEECGLVQDWLQAQVLSAMNDAAARYRHGRGLPTSGEWQKEPEKTRAAIAKSLATAWCRGGRER